MLRVGLGLEGRVSVIVANEPREVLLPHRGPDSTQTRTQWGGVNIPFSHGKGRVEQFIGNS